MLCAPRDGPRKSGFVMYFCAVYNYRGKAGLGQSYWNPKRKLGATRHFSEIIKLQLGKINEYHFTLFSILKLF